MKYMEKIEKKYIYKYNNIIMANIDVHDNILTLPSEIQLTIFKFLNSKDMISIINR